MGDSAQVNAGGRREHVGMLLRSIEKIIQSGDLERGLDVIRSLHKCDVKNMYTNALEERILMLIVKRNESVALKHILHPMTPE